MKSRWYTICFVCFVSSWLGLACVPDIKTTEGNFQQKEILGFTQFSVWRSDSLLGFSKTDAQSFNHCVWEGMIQQGQAQQDITIEYSGREGLGASANFLGVASASLAAWSVEKVRMRLINPVEYTLRNPSPAVLYANNTDMLALPYIGAMLKVERIEVEFFASNGMKLDVGARLKIVNPSVQYQKTSGSQSTWTAQNAFVGYRLSTPPANAASLGVFALEYQFLRQPIGSSSWQVIQHRDTIKSGEHFKFMLRATHQAHVYVFNIDSGKNVHLLFPRREVRHSNPLQAGKSYHFPDDATLAYEVDRVRGTEEVVVLVFRSRNESMEQLVQTIEKNPLTAAQFQSQDVISGLRGLGTIKQTRVENNTILEGLDQTGTRVLGLPSDYKMTMLFNHE